MRKLLFALAVAAILVCGIAPKNTPLVPQPAGAAVIQSCVESAMNPHDLWKAMVCLYDMAAEWWRNGQDGATWWSDRGGT